MKNKPYRWEVLNKAKDPPAGRAGQKQRYRGYSAKKSWD